MLRGVQAGDQAETPPAGQVVPGLVRKRLARAQRLLRLHCKGISPAMAKAMQATE